MKTHFEVYEAKDGWRWRAKRAGRIVAECGEAYVRKSVMKRSLNHFLASVAATNFTIGDAA